MSARFLILGFACGLAAWAQQPAGENTGDYNIFASVEPGYRFHEVNGDLGKYRSDVNYGNGIRLLSGSFQANSRDGNGALFDHISLQTLGLGNDPYESASLRVEKNRLYRYDLLWRLNDYYNPALPLAGGQHLIDTRRTMQDHDLTLLPGRAIQFFVGYSRNLQDGPALTTTQIYQPGVTEIPLFENIRRLDNEYRLGGEASFFGARLTVMHGWVNYSDTSPQSATGPLALNGATLDQFSRVEPYSGSSPYWRANLQKQARTWAAAARFSYAGSRRRFFFGETATGTDRFGTAQNLQTQVEGSGSRPVGTGNLTLSYFPGSRLTITSQTSFYNTRMAGDNSFVQLNNETLAAQFLSFQFLGIRNIGTALDVNYRAAKWIGIYTGYHFDTRRIQSAQAAAMPAYEQNNDLHSGLLGLRLQPLKPLSINLDAEIGRASRPIFPIGDRNYHLLGARVQYKRRTLLLSAAARTNYNINSVSVTAFSSRARNYSADVSWTPRAWFGMDASYTKLHLNTLGGIAYFAAGQFVTGDQSVYVSNIHAGNITAHFAIRSRVELDLGYSRVQDTGDGRGAPAASSEGGSSLPIFLAAQTFPLTFESPLARVSVKIHPRLHWNAGYQFYHYTEQFEPRQLYNAHTGYTSVTWTF